MMNLQDRIKVLSTLGEYLRDGGDDAMERAIRKAYFQNRWFSEGNSKKALAALAEQMLDTVKLHAWAVKYGIKEVETNPLNIGVVMAGNIPLVGFHDWLCVFFSGHHARVKLSDKDKVLLPFLLKKMGEWMPEVQKTTYFLTEHERLSGFEAVIATGSNNTARYFKQYFSKYPNIIRRNRTSVAVLTGEESIDDLRALSIDFLAYFGLGCRNVSKLYVPEEYAFMPLLEALHEHKEMIQHDKYKNNFDYNKTLFILNKINHHMSGNLLLREDKSIFARIASAHFEYYSDLEVVNEELLMQADDIQCVVCADSTTIVELPRVSFGETQRPSLTDYADGVDVMEFLKKLKSK